MARQRKNLGEHTKEPKSRNSSSSNGSSIHNNTKAPKPKSILSYWKQLAFVTVLGVTVVFGVMGYLQTRVNTPFDDKKVSRV